MDTYEKKYKAALERAKKLASDLPNGRNDRIYHIWDLESIFPELAESEDERIRKEMIEVIRKEAKEFPSSIIAENASSWIAWLEKQGEQKLPIEKLPSETKTIGKSLGFTTQEDCDRYNQMVSDLIMSDDDKGEQKPADKIEPFDKYEGLTDFERTLADICIGWIGEEIGWKQYIKDNADVLLKIAVEKFNSVQDVPFEQKPAWSEEDERILNGLISSLARIGANTRTDSTSINYTFSREIDWIKSLKSRLQ